MSKNFKYILDFVGNNGQLVNAINQSERKLTGLGSVASNTQNKLGGMMSGAAKQFLAVGSFAAIGAGATKLITNIIDVRSEFEKYEAVLTNSLGSSQKAAGAMKMLQEFATQTPFALTELTGSFVKLTNYGLKPSIDDMRSYGDIASSVGKGFDQLAEALADAVTGEFERLKEFGVKAKKEGDKVTFTFKEQATTVDNTAASIKKYVTELGNLQGVSGSMAAISETLGGKISNLGDAWDGLMNTMGEQSSGTMVSVVEFLTTSLNAASQATTLFADENVSGLNKLLMLFGNFGAVVDAAGQSIRALPVVNPESEGGPLEKATQKAKEYDGSIKGLNSTLTDYKNQLLDIEPTDRGALMAKLAQISAIETQIAAIDKLKASMAGMAADEKAGLRDDKLTPLAARGTSAQNVGWDLYSSVDQVDPTKLVGTDQMNENLEENKKRVASWREQLVNDAQMVGDAFAQGFGMIGQSIVNGLGLAQDGLEGFVSGLASTVTELIAMFLGQSIAASIAGATTSGTATGPAAVFTTPAFIATAVSGVLGAFAAIPKFADGGVVFGPTMGMIGEYPGARSNPEVIAPLSKLQEMIGGGRGPSLKLQPSLELGYNGLMVKLKQEEQNTYKRT